ncbi:unnamed protein product, partial [Symbiodinium sp. KB8]
MTSSMRCLLFRMLSRGGSSVQHLVTDVHKGFPFQLFRCLAGPAAAAEVKDSRPCLRDPVAAWMLRNFPEPRDLCSDRAGLRHHVHRSEAQLQSSSAGPPECADLADGLCTSVGRLGCQAACAAQAEVFKRGARNREEENWPPGKDTLAQAWCGGPYRAFVHLNCKGKQLKLQGGWQRYTPTGVTQDGDLAFTIEPIQALDAFVVCFCAPSPGGGLCSASSLSTYHQTIGVLDVRGATPNQQFSCGRGGRCTLEITGRGLGTADRVKIVNSTTLCSGEPQETGFFKSLLLADPAPATSSTLARFSLGQVTAGGIFKVCYCANLDSCNSLAAFNHQAGELEIEDPLLDVTLESSTVASVTVQVTSTLDSTSSYIRCAISEYEPSYLPNGADIANGIAPIGLGQGEATSPTQPGANSVEMFFTTFVKPLQ